MPFEPLIPANAVALAGTYGAPQTGVAGLRTLANLRSELTSGLGNRDDVDQPTLDGYINDACVEMAGLGLDLPQLKTSFQFSTTLNEYQYLLPSGVWVVDSMALRDTTIYGNGIPLNKITDEQVWFTLRETSSNRVTEFLQKDRVIGVWPNPNVVNTLIVNAQILPQPLVNDGDQPLFGREFEVALLDYCRYIGHSRLREFDMAAQCLNQALANLRQKMSKTAATRSNATPGARVVRTAAELNRLRGGPSRGW